MASIQSPKFLSNLRKGIVQTFDLSGLKILCADLGINYQSLAGETIDIKALELISYMNRRGQISQLIQYCVSERPQYSWPQEGPSLIEMGNNANSKTVILFMASDPSNAARLRLSMEAREIQEKLQLATMRDFFELKQRWSVRSKDLIQVLLDEQPNIVHFSGHGTDEGELCLEDQFGKIRAVEPDALAALFELVTDRVQCVVLNACYSEIQANAIAAHIPYVIGMSQAIEDRASIAFTVGFYQALAGGRSFEDAFKFGCVQIRLEGIPEHLIPVLIKKTN